MTPLEALEALVWAADPLVPDPQANTRKAYQRLRKALASWVPRDAALEAMHEVWVKPPLRQPFQGRVRGALSNILDAALAKREQGEGDQSVCDVDSRGIPTSADSGPGAATTMPTEGADCSGAATPPSPTSPPPSEPPPEPTAYYDLGKVRDEIEAWRARCRWFEQECERLRNPHLYADRPTTAGDSPR